VILKFFSSIWLDVCLVVSHLFRITEFQSLRTWSFVRDVKFFQPNVDMQSASGVPSLCYTHALCRNGLMARVYEPTDRIRRFISASSGIVLLSVTHWCDKRADTQYRQRRNLASLTGELYWLQIGQLDPCDSAFRVLVLCCFFSFFLSFFLFCVVFLPSGVISCSFPTYF